MIYLAVTCVRFPYYFGFSFIWIEFFFRHTDDDNSVYSYILASNDDVSFSSTTLGDLSLWNDEVDDGGGVGRYMRQFVMIMVR